MKGYRPEKRAVPIGPPGQYDNTVSVAISTMPTYVPDIIWFKCKSEEDAAKLRERFMEHVRTGAPMRYDGIDFI